MTDRRFKETVYAYYRTHGRHTLPWRKTRDPYKILVSEMMLQQTQVPRVLPKYRAFLRRFPSIRALAEASRADVLREWQGLGYNRRAKLLHECAQSVAGKLPRTYRELIALPGIGPYTAAAVMAFAYNEPVTLIETNVRTVYLHHFFASRTNVSDAELLPHIERTLDQENPREWYAALMDYGSFLKRSIGNQNVRSRHHAVQTKFKGSDREIRGAIIRALSESPMTIADLRRKLAHHDHKRIAAQLAALAAEGMIRREGRRYAL